MLVKQINRLLLSLKEFQTNKDGSKINKRKRNF